MTITINGNGTVTGISVGGLPDGIVDNDMLAANVNTITVVDQWQITADVSTGDSLLTSNWARTDDTATGSYQVFGRIGTGMSQSSGVFTFPTTGIWRIDFTAAAYKADYPRRWLTARIQATKDNSTYVDTSLNYSSSHADSGTSVYGYSTVSTFFDVTSTSDCKVKFGVYSDGAMTWMSDSTNGTPYTNAFFTRLGDT